MTDHEEFIEKANINVSSKIIKQNQCDVFNMAKEFKHWQWLIILANETHKNKTGC